MKNIRAVLIIIAFPLFPITALAELNYDAASFSYGTVSQSGYPNMTAYQFGITKGLAEYTYVGARYEIDAQPSGTALALDLGLRVPVQGNTDLVFTGTILNGSSDNAGLSISSSGYQLATGIKAELAPRLLGEFGVRYANVNVSAMGAPSSKVTSTGTNVLVGYRISPQYELFVELDSTTTRQVPVYSTSLFGLGAKIYY
ncbi:MAG: hypothetical protein HY016_03135 [Nitrosomonadales bacterium]|nr:hypothetical protein [Nitrosomonadales bacterium]